MYNTVIIGGGAGGLFCGALTEVENSLILEGEKETGRKLMVTGSGQCNLTHGGNIKEFVDKYGEKGKKIRSLLYKFSNDKVMEFFESKGMKLFEREDGKIFPKSLSARDVRNLLLENANDNGWQIKTDKKVENIELSESGNGWLVKTTKGEEFSSRNLIIAVGGCSYKNLGSDGNLMEILKSLGINIVPQEPALVPVFVENYPFSDLSGIAFSEVIIKKKDGDKTVSQNKGDLLFTHKNLSGPAILDFSAQIKTGDVLEIVFYNGDNIECKGVKKSIQKHFVDSLKLPERFIEKVISMAGVEPKTKAASVNGNAVKEIHKLLRGMKFVVSGKGSFSQAMLTSGGVDLSEVDLKTLECKKHPKLFFIGEVLDVSGNTGGYNLQFAFSSAAAVSKKLQEY